MRFVYRGQLKANLEGAIEAIEQARREFDAEAQLAHVVNTKSQLDNTNSQLDDIQRVLSDCQHSQGSATSVFSVAWPQNGKFLGRTQELDQLVGFLEPSDVKQRSCVLHGIAGVGKTQTAMEFCYRYREIFPYIIWVPSEDEAVLANAYARISSLFRLQPSSKTEEADPSSDIDGSHQWLCQSKTSQILRGWDRSTDNS